jgi:hypothetical protein
MLPEVSMMVNLRRLIYHEVQTGPDPAAVRRKVADR